MTNPFLTDKENELVDQFSKNGYVIFPIEDKATLDGLRNNLYQKAKALVDGNTPEDIDVFFNQIHQQIKPDDLNDFKVQLIRELAEDSTVRPSVYRIARTFVDCLVGNELAMQRACNLSVQLPGDPGALLPLHADVWSGNSPFEVVFWLPFVDCYKTKSMYILPKEKNDKVYANFQDYAHMTAEELFQAIKADVEWIDVPYGHGAIFSHTLLHGNRVNDEQETRWTFNVRFKELLSPYGSKQLGESFLPITMRPVTRIGCEYQKPELTHG